MTRAYSMVGVALILAVTACPALAETLPANDDGDGVDCFHAEVRDDASCRSALPVDIAPQALDPGSGADTGTVDCFFAANLENPLCQQIPAATAEIKRSPRSSAR